MKFVVRHEIRGRVRVHFYQKDMSIRQADLLHYYLCTLPGVKNVRVYERTADAAVVYEGSRRCILEGIQRFSYDSERMEELVPKNSGRALNREYKEKLVRKVVVRAFAKSFLPASVRAVYTAAHSVRYLLKGVRCLLRGKLEVEVLDAAAIAVSVLRRDFDTAGSVMFLLGIGELLEEWTRKKSVGDLARSMSLNIAGVWQNVDGTEVLVPVSKIREGDLVTVHMGNVIPLDGVVASGDAMVNQASMTGESVPVRKEEGSYVYAGTAVEEGEITLRVRTAAGDTRFERIVTMIEESEQLKSTAEGKAATLADALVPWSLGGTILTWLLTRNVTKALSILMVDFSCALKLAMPLSVLSAMREAGSCHITVKGGRYMEAVAAAHTIVFDKTGTITQGKPQLVSSYTYGNSGVAALQLLASLEAKSEHPLSQAILVAAENANLDVLEMDNFSSLTGRGLTASYAGKTYLAGNQTLMAEEKVDLTSAQADFQNLTDDGETPIFLAEDGKLIGLFGVSDQVKADSADMVAALHQMGKEVIMLTGDNDQTAQAIAQKVGIKRVISQVLPQEKSRVISDLQVEGKSVIMVGDGINDAPALATADIGIAMGSGTDIAMESADMVLMKPNLMDVVKALKISQATITTIKENLFWAFIYNILSIPAAMGVLHLFGGPLLDPMIAGFAMSFSSVSVVLNSLRLKRCKI